MNIVVLISKVPEPANHGINPVATFFGRTVLQGVSYQDKVVIEEGLRLKEKLGTGKVVAIAAGVREGQYQLREALSMGCDDAILIDDKENFDTDEDNVSAGSTLSKAIKRLGEYNVVLCGSDVSEDMICSVGSEISEKLNIARIDSVSKVEKISPGVITVQRKRKDECKIVDVPSPAVIMIGEEANKPRVPSVKDKIRARKKQIPVWPLKELDEPGTHSSYEEDRDRDIETHPTPDFSGIKTETEEKEDINEDVVSQNETQKEEQSFEEASMNDDPYVIEHKDDTIEIEAPERNTENNIYEDTEKTQKEKNGGKIDFLSYWGLREKPFENTGSVRYFYYSPTHKEALVRLIYVIKQQKAGAMLAGGYGTGKTTIAKELLMEIEQNDSYKSVYISNPILSSTELLQEIAYLLGCESENESRLILRRNITKKLQENASNNNHTVILVDEAHLISRKDVLEELRLFMNLQYKEKFLTSIILMGQLVLREIIDSMPQFKQRFAMCYLLKHLDEDETRKYIKHRLKVAGTERDIFTDKAISMTYLSSEGRPRQINNICDMALLIGHMRNADHIDDEMIREIVKDLGQEL